ncbi:MAG: hypothetical protein D6722_18525 [Bacteroidetes bacterium]|nr:MAG: hypothetical protein D6722_18525 [Bacteroidota bacterium]
MIYVRQEVGFWLGLMLIVIGTGCRPATSGHETPDVAPLPPPQAHLQGWNTWDNRSIWAQVLLPEGFALRFMLEDTVANERLALVFTGNKVLGSEKVRTLAHTPDGSYTASQVMWRAFNLTLVTVARGDSLMVCVLPELSARNPGRLVVLGEFPYGDAGSLSWTDQAITVETQGRNITLAADRPGRPAGEICSWDLSGPLTLAPPGLGTEAVQAYIRQAESAYWQRRQAYGQAGQAWHVIQNAVNWLVVYDPAQDRSVTPVARTWSYGWGQRQPGGHVLFCWDNFFVAYMHALESRDLAYNEVEQMTRLIDTLGFVPNYAGPGYEYSRDRSQPPVGGLMVREVYRLHPEPAFLAAHFDRLLRWNRWWPEHRDYQGYMAWGSDPYTGIQHRRQQIQNNHPAASNESGLDNTPMYDGVPFDTAHHILMQADVGLMGLYIADCEALAEMADLLDRPEEARELSDRADAYRAKLQTLWHEEFGLFLNKRLDTEEWSFRISPTNFYALLGGAATQDQAERMMEDHFYNPAEFWGDYILPSAARNDTAYTGRDYWRGSIWAPMNFLTYLGLRRYDLPQARLDLADKSLKLLLKNWEANGQILENYHAETGGYPGYRSEYFYHWGALLGMISLIETGQVPAPERALSDRD